MKRVAIALSSLILLVVAGACGDNSGASTPSGNCPRAKVEVVVTVDQWGDIVSDLAGGCGTVTTMIKSSSIDPHDYEPTPGDNAKFSGAKLVVVNGLDYDPWADKAIEALSNKPVVVNGGDVVGLKAGDNPHIWYGPDFVYKVADSVTAALKQLAPDAASYFDQLNSTWHTAMKPYDAEIAAVTAKATGKTYGATESVFDYMAATVGLHNLTPQGYQNAAANESEPAPADLNDFQSGLQQGRINVLVYNTQTEGAGPQQIRDVAKKAKVPVVDVTETVKPGTKGFVDWQVGQLQQLDKALG